MVQPGFFALHPAVLPPLPAGSYTLHGEIEDMPHGPIAPDRHAAEGVVAAVHDAA